MIESDAVQQVSNIGDCIKVACDFMSMERLQDTITVSRELRAQHIKVAWGDDVLCLYSTLWFCWKILLQNFQGYQSSGSTFEKEYNGEYLHFLADKFCTHHLP